MTATRRSTRVTVDRCVCHDVRFTTVLDWASDEGSSDLEAIRERFGCTSSCGMCRQYLVEALRTGHAAVGLMMPGQAP